MAVRKIKPSLYLYKARCERVVDGDTFKLYMDLGFGVWSSNTIRLYGVDAYETRLGKNTNKAQKELGKRASTLVDGILIGNDHKDILVETIRNKKGSFSRYLANVYVPIVTAQWFTKVSSDVPAYMLDGKKYVSLADLLVAEGLAVVKEYK